MCNEVSCVKKVPVNPVRLLIRVQVNDSVREDEMAQWLDECFTANEYNVTGMKLEKKMMTYVSCSCDAALALSCLENSTTWKLFPSSENVFMIVNAEGIEERDTNVR